MSAKKEANIRDHATEFMEQSKALAIEDSIWWAVGRRAILETFLDVAANMKSGAKNIVEIGCGSGGDLALLSRYGRVWGVERSNILAARARDRGVAQDVLSETDVLDDSIPEGADLYCMFDVLEHIEDDRGFIRELAQKPTKEHLFLLSVPACQALYGPHDELLHHYRRYSRTGLVRLLESEGYEVVSSGYFMFFLFPLAVASRFWEGLKTRFGRKSTTVNIGIAPAPVNWLFIRILRLEAFLGRYVRFPFGLWVMALARRCDGRAPPAR